jgi:hypothetical protein
LSLIHHHAKAKTKDEAISTSLKRIRGRVRVEKVSPMAADMGRDFYHLQRTTMAVTADDHEGESELIDTAV